MKIFVTGAAGFIGSHLCEKLLKDPANTVIGLDDFIGPTPFAFKLTNIQDLTKQARFQLIKGNILNVNLREILQDIDVVYHLAAIPGVRSSWGTQFENYAEQNILATQRLLEACRNSTIKKFIFGSTSSVYGEKVGKVSEDAALLPLSPYGVTKLTGEKLCRIYLENFQVPTVVLRFFTVYGPRQRPDMAFHRFIKQIIQDEPITIFGDGEQTRDFTYIEDCVNGIASVLHADHVIGETMNIGGTERVSINRVITLLESISNKKASCVFSHKPAGDPNHTWADISQAKRLLNYEPSMSLQDGLQAAYDYFLPIYGGGHE